MTLVMFQILTVKEKRKCFQVCFTSNCIYISNIDAFRVWYTTENMALQQVDKANRIPPRWLHCPRKGEPLIGKI